MKALIGYSGYVGSSLLRQQAFDCLYRSTDVHEARGKSFSIVICAGAPAKKWIADRDPEADQTNLSDLFDVLASVNAEQFVLISTIDVFGDTRGRDERSRAEPGSAYGRNRLWLEDRVREAFPSSLIVRLPGLVGPGLRKNVIFDFLNDNNLHQIDRRSRYQFYPTVNLTRDLEIARKHDLRLVHLTTEPIAVSRVAEAFGRDFANEVHDKTPADYNLRTLHAPLFGGEEGYLYDARTCELAIRAYAQSEPRSKPAA
jgi:dTDP-4-dehydrorhamnose reductase